MRSRVLYDCVQTRMDLWTCYFLNWILDPENFLCEGSSSDMYFLWNIVKPGIFYGIMDRRDHNILPYESIICNIYDVGLHLTKFKCFVLVFSLPDNGTGSETGSSILWNARSWADSVSVNGRKNVRMEAFIPLPDYVCHWHKKSSASGLTQ